MFCKKCGSTLRDNAKFCGSCGAMVEVTDNSGNQVNYNAPAQGRAPSYTTPVQRTPSYTTPVQPNRPMNAAPQQPNRPANAAPQQPNRPMNAAPQQYNRPMNAAPQQPGNAPKANPIQSVTAVITNAAGKVKSSGVMKKLPKKALPIIGGAVALVLVLVLIFSGIFAGDAGTVAKAFSKSVKAYTAVADTMKLPDMTAIAESGKYNQELKLWFEDGADELDGLGIRFALSYNQSGEEATLIAAPFFEDTDLITGQMKFKGSKVYIGCPELMEQTYLMLDTKTIGQDLADKDADGMEDLSFNMFTLIEQIQKASALTKDQEKALEKAGTAFAKAIEVEKDGKHDIKVNGKKLSCTVYNVMIPQEAMEDYLDVLEDVLSDMDGEAIADILEEAGFPVDEMGLYFGNDDVLDLIDSLKDVVDEVGDLELEVGINKGYIVSVECELEGSGETLTLNIQLGGGDNYVDDISIELLDEDEYGYVITSTGNHAMEKGVFTDETVASLMYYGDEEELFTTELRWEPKAKNDNFEFVMYFEGEELTAEGTVTCSKNSLNINISELEVDGTAIGFSYILGEYKAPSIKMGETLAFADMDDSDLEDLGEMISDNGEAWAEMMEDDYSDIFDYLYYMF